MAERASVLQQQEIENKQETIFDHYDIDNEAKFLRKVEDLPLAAKHFYIKENILGFLGEYAGEIPYKKISYTLEDGRLTYTGLDAMTSYWRSAKLAGTGSREWYEVLGMEAVRREFAISQANQATIISPPKDADYGFVFHFSDQGFDADLQENLIQEHILRYDEEKGQIENSLKIASGLSFEELGGKFKTVGDFLQNPAFSFSAGSSAELDRILEMMGFGEDALEKSQRFEQAITKDRRISAWIDRYFEGIIQLSNLDSGTIDYVLLKEELELLLAGIYNRAKDVKEQLENSSKLKEYSPSPIFTDVIVHPVFTNPLEELRYYADKRPLSVSGGGCPTVKSGSDTLGFVSVSDIHSGLEQGLSTHDMLESKIEASSGEKKKIKCPECGWEPTAEQLQAIKEGTLTRCPGEDSDGKRCNWDPCTKTRH